MRFLVDQNLPASVSERLTDTGHEAQHASSAGLAPAEDSDVFEWCRVNGSILITGDKKLTKFLAEEKATSPTVVVCRGYYEDKTTLGNDLLANVDVIEATINNRGHAVFSLGPGRPMRVQLLPLVDQ